MRVYGPYSNGKEGRLIVVLISDDGVYASQSYPRYLMEQALGRPLLEDEHVHHIDEDRTNNALDNLEVLSVDQHKEKHSAPTVDCMRCGTATKNKLYCSDRCARIASRKVERPSPEVLRQEIASMSWVAIASKYGVSDNAVRKWARSYGLLGV